MKVIAENSLVLILKLIKRDQKNYINYKRAKLRNEYYWKESWEKIALGIVTYFKFILNVNNGNRNIIIINTNLHSLLLL